jgi:hypothetical protein
VDDVHFSHDGVIPGSKVLQKVDHQLRSLIRTGSSFHHDSALPNRKRRGLFVAFMLVWFSCTMSFILGLPSLGSLIAFSC